MTSRECETCIKRKTVYCPTSIECMATDDKPYYQNRIMLLEENQQLKDNWDELKEWVNKSYDYYSNNADYIGGRLCFTDMKNNMRELEQGGEIND